MDQRFTLRLDLKPFDTERLKYRRWARTSGCKWGEVSSDQRHERSHTDFSIQLKLGLALGTANEPDAGDLTLPFSISELWISLIDLIL